jgi:hypothetical protein
VCENKCNEDRSAKRLARGDAGCSAERLACLGDVVGEPFGEPIGEAGADLHVMFRFCCGVYAAR